MIVRVDQMKTNQAMLILKMTFLGCLFLISCSSSTTVKTSTARAEKNKTAAPSVHPSETIPSIPIPTQEKTSAPVLPPSTATSTAMAFATATVTATPILVATATQVNLEQPLSSRYIAITTSGKELFLVEIQTGYIRQLKTEVVNPIYLMDFIKNGCEIITTDRDNRILQLDLKGEVVKELLPAGWYQEDGFVARIKINPKGPWISYLVGRGKPGYDLYEKQDIETMNLEDKSIYKLTEHGGAWEAPWSPDGKWIAFSDLDNNNRSQIYIAQQDGKGKRQLTNFMGEDQKFFLLVWSPDGKKIAFRSHKSNDPTTSFGVVYFDSTAPLVRKFPEFQADVGYMWWEDDETLVVRTQSSGKDKLDEIIWLNIKDGKIIDRLSSAQTPDQFFESANYFDRWTVGFFSDRGFFTYNTKTKTINRYFDNLLDYIDWSFAPLNFPGEENCN